MEKHLAATKTIASRGISADAAILSVRLGYVQGYLRYLAQDWSSVLPLANDSSEESTLLRLQAALRVPSLAPVAKKEMAVLYRLLTRTPETDVFLLQYEFLQVVAQPDDSDPEALLVIDEKANALARTLIAGSGIETYPLLHDLGCLRLSVTYSYLESQCTLLEADQEAITPKAFSEVLDRSLELISEVTACEKQLSHSSVSISPASALGAAELVIKQHVMMNRVATLVVTLPQEHSARFEQRYAVDKATLLARINSLTTVNGGKLSNELCAGLFTLAQMEFIKNDISSAIDLLREARGIATRHEIEAMLSVKIDYVYAIAVTAVAREKMETSGLAGILPCSSQLNEAVTVFRYFEENSGRRPAPREDWIGQRADALLMTYILHVAANDLAKSDVIAKEIRQAVKSGGMPFLDQVRNSWADVLSRQTDSDVQEKVNQLYHIGG